MRNNYSQNSFDKSEWIGVHFFTNKGLKKYLNYLIEMEAENQNNPVEVVGVEHIDVLHGDIMKVKHLPSITNLNGLSVDVFADFICPDSIISGVCNGLLAIMDEKFTKNEIIRMLYESIVFNRVNCFESAFLNINLKLIRRFYKLWNELFPYGSEFESKYILNLFDKFL